MVYSSVQSDTLSAGEMFSRSPIQHCVDRIVLLYSVKTNKTTHECIGSCAMHEIS